MKKYQVKNINDVTPNVTKADGNEYSVKSLVDGNVLENCNVALVEVLPNNFAYGYHYHEAKEEIFYIISGEGSVRTIDGEIPVKSGDAISFPIGEGGTHIIKNTSNIEKLVYLDFGTCPSCDIAHLPDIKKIMVVSKEVFGIYDEPSK